MTETLRISAISLSGGTQPRAGLDQGVVADYAQAMRDGSVFPPVVVMHDGSNYYLVDGFHRVAAASMCQANEIAADIRQGTLEDAQWESYAVNSTHGLRRTNGDKRRAVKAALKHPNGVNKSNREIARHVGVDDKTVASIRAEMEATAEIPQSDQRVGGDGRTINTANIGKKEDVEPNWFNRVQADKYYPVKGWIKLIMLVGFDSPVQMVSDERYATTWSPVKGSVLKGKEYWGFTGEIPSVREEVENAPTLLQTLVNDKWYVVNKAEKVVYNRQFNEPTEGMKAIEAIGLRTGGTWWGARLKGVPEFQDYWLAEWPEADNAGVVPTKTELPAEIAALNPSGWYAVGYRDDDHVIYTNEFGFDHSDIAILSHYAELCVMARQGHVLQRNKGYWEYELREIPQSVIDDARAKSAADDKSDEPEILPVENRVWLNSGGVVSAAELNAILPAETPQIEDFGQPWHEGEMAAAAGVDEEGDSEVESDIAGLLRSQVEYIIAEYSGLITGERLIELFETVVAEIAEQAV